MYDPKEHKNRARRNGKSSGTIAYREHSEFARRMSLIQKAELEASENDYRIRYLDNVPVGKTNRKTVTVYATPEEKFVDPRQVNKEKPAEMSKVGGKVLIPAGDPHKRPRFRIRRFCSSHNIDSFRRAA